MLYKIVSAIVKFGTEFLCRIDALDMQRVPLRGPLILYSTHTGQVAVAEFFGQLQPRPLTAGQKWRVGIMRS